MAKAKRQRRSSIRTMGADSSALETLEALESLERAERSAARTESDDDERETAPTSGREPEGV